ncbi:MAG: Gfo/Idh/MocA family protein [Nitrospinaceae bacterium]
MKGAIIGFGHIAAEGHLPAYSQRKDMVISAVYDQNTGRKSLVQRKLPAARFYTSIDELFQHEDLDFVDIATYPASHMEYIRAAASRRLNILCEKPLVLREDHFGEIEEYFHSGTRSVFSVHNWKYAPIFVKTEALLRSKRIGEIQNIRYEVLRTGPSVAASTHEGGTNWRLQPDLSGGGILVDHGWHAFYTLCHWIRKRPRTVECLLENRKFKELPVEDTATLKIRFDQAEAELFFSWAARERKNTIFITGTQGRLNILDDTIHLITGQGETVFPFDEALSKGSHHPEWYRMVLDDFVRSMTDREIRDQNFREAALSLSLLANAQVSHQEGGKAVPVHVNVSPASGESK